MFIFLLKTAIFAHKNDYLRTRIFQRITQAQPQVCYSKQLVLGVEIVVEDFNFESQVLLMRTNLDNSYWKEIQRDFLTNMQCWISCYLSAESCWSLNCAHLTLIDEKISPVRIQAVLLGLRPSQHLRLMLLEEVQDPNLSKTWKLPVVDGLEMRM